MEPGHQKAECPKLKGGKNMDYSKSKGKDKQVHIVQVLPLKIQNFKEVRVVHMDCSHACYVT